MLYEKIKCNMPYLLDRCIISFRLAKYSRFQTMHKKMEIQKLHKTSKQTNTKYAEKHNERNYTNIQQS